MSLAKSRGTPQPGAAEAVLNSLPHPVMVIAPICEAGVCVFTGVAMAMIRLLRVDMSGEALRERIEANLAREQQPELCRIHLVRGIGDLTATMPRFVTAYLERQFGAA